MKICFVHRHYPPEGRGGICTYIATLARGLVQAGHTIHVIARAETGGDRVEEDQGVTVHRLAALSPNPTMNAVMTGVGHLVRKTTGKFANRLWAGRRIANRLEALVTQGDIDLVETAEWEAELLWYLRHSKNRVPTVVNLHGPMAIIREVNRDRIRRAEAEHHPGSDFNTHKGYPCPRPKVALRGMGPTAIHRRTWAFMDDLPWTGVPRVAPFSAQGTLFG